MTSTINIIDTTTSGDRERTGKTQVTSPTPIISDEWEQGGLGQASIIRQVFDLYIRDDDEDEKEFVAPTEHATSAIFTLLESLGYKMDHEDEHCQMPDGHVITDYEGGIRIEWWAGRKYCVTLVMGHDEAARDYVFVKLEEGCRGKIDDRTLPALSVRLATHLKQLSKWRDSIGE
jgi:hypothetical protein